MGPHPAVAEIRRAVRLALADLPEGALVLAACSGGADSLALAACLAFGAPRLGLRAGLVSVDHGLQEGSRERAEEVVVLAGKLALAPAEAISVTVGTAGGPEAAARDARYAALSASAGRLGAAAVLLGHTREDQAETVLLRLARGSGTRSLAGMPASAGLYRRPLLGVARRTTRLACEALGLLPWDDPHNIDRAYTRVRVRHDVLPVLEGALGPGVTEALARTAALCRDDADALDAWAGEAYERLRREAGAGTGGAEGGAVELPVAGLEGLPAAVRRRVLQRAALAAGADGSALAAVHIEQADRLVTAWRGQRRVELPGGVGVVRRYGTLILASTHT
ncbi:tRNA(Ile)-lysidine synthase [Sphaerisporangium melleum]|uniref:tRNA(Ile)-lysidine synthase n=1 Tax=Sphaerisporangium melleum TaxID=321316 RepID=A0A917QZ58_9ACTN|nr:tRNA lysidine(34) synthetase TilS [Sphaerisporangium melleum]GGK79966.1 tRNA(Ile)-lysidine synthase [Sphaerisporangium melleum]GII72109.1 tRNA(Ile)-lysidine synthase [Sphaerisporangium melleum]